jgi:hypothetical protein
LIKALVLSYIQYRAFKLAQEVYIYKKYKKLLPKNRIKKEQVAVVDLSLLLNKQPPPSLAPLLTV